MSGHAVFATPAQRTTHFPRRNLTVVRKQPLREDREGQETVPEGTGRELTLSELREIHGATVAEIESMEDLTTSGIETLRDQSERRYQGNGGLHPSENAGTCVTGETTALLTSGMWRRHSFLHEARKNLEAAIAALEAGEANIYYTGHCTRCGDFIGLPRLSAVPETLVCCKCG